jgi:hypothetical protein
VSPTDPVMALAGADRAVRQPASRGWLCARHATLSQIRAGGMRSDPVEPLHTNRFLPH